MPAVISVLSALKIEQRKLLMSGLAEREPEAIGEDIARYSSLKPLISQWVTPNGIQRSPNLQP